MGDPFVEQLKTVCRDHPVRPKWVILPAPGIGWTLGERLLHEGCNWINLRFATPFQLALESLGPQLLARGIHPCPDGLGPPLIQRLLFELDSPYFGELRTQPGMARALWNTLQEFRLTGLRAEDLSRLAPSQKHDALRELFHAYERHLEVAGWADRADILRQPPSNSVIKEDDIVVPYPYTQWAPLEEQLLRTLPGKLLIPEATDIEPPTGWPQRLPQSVKGPTPHLFCAHRRHDELDEIVRRILEAQIPLDQVEICALPEEAPLIRERLAQAGFACTVEAGLPISLSRPGQALSALLDWIEHGYTAFHLRELLLADLLRARPNSFTSARLLHSARIGWGRESYVPRLRTLASVYARRGYAQGQQHCEELMAWLESVLNRLPSNKGEAGAWMQGLRSIFETEFVARDEEMRAKDLLLHALSELQSLPGQDWSVSRLIHQARQRLFDLQAGSSRPQAGKVHVTRPSLLGLSGRPHVFLVGLEEGRWLTRQSPDCVLDDEERALLHPGLRLSRDLPAFIDFQLRERMATLSGTLTLSRACYDRQGDQEQVSSWIYREAAKRTNEIRVVPTRGPALSDDALQTLHPALHRGQQAALYRREAILTAWDGLVPEAAGLWDPRNTGEPVSVSRLTALATCPYQVFLELGLKLPRGIPRLPDPDVWLDPLTRGILVHDVLATYHRERCSPDQIQGVLQRQLEIVKSTFPPPSKSHEIQETAELERDLIHFLRLEELAGEHAARALEVSFGLPLGKDSDPLARAEPVWYELDDGSRVPLCGRIDRIDQLPEGFGIIDYKTGKSLYTKSDALYSRGRLLQHALYAVAAEELVGPVVRSSYYFVSPGAARTWWHFPAPDRERLGRVLRLVLEPLRTGVFVHTHERSEDCRFCDYKPVCASQCANGTAEKLQWEENRELHSRRGLLQEP